MEERKGRGTARRESRPTGIGEWVEGRGGRTTTKGKEFVGALAHQRDYGRPRLRSASAFIPLRRGKSVRHVGNAALPMGKDGFVAFE